MSLVEVFRVAGGLSASAAATLPPLLYGVSGEDRAWPGATPEAMGETGLRQRGDGGWLAFDGGGLGKASGGGVVSRGETFSDSGPCWEKYESARRRFDGGVWNTDSAKLPPATVLQAVVEPRRLLETDCE